MVRLSSSGSVNETYNKRKQICLNNIHKHLDKMKFLSEMVKEKPDQKGRS